MITIAHIENGMTEKFGIPRQSGLVNDVYSTIVFEPEFRNPDALKGLEGFSHIWLIWAFDRDEKNKWSPMVRPPRLGGNTRMGVFATRSPNRPNPIGLSCVKIVDIKFSERGPLICVAGADLKDHTQIYDIKPYLPYADSHPDALSGFAGDVYGHKLEICFPSEISETLSPEKIKAIGSLLEQDPRPSYQNDPDRVYGMTYSGLNIHFKVEGSRLTVTDVTPDRS